MPNGWSASKTESWARASSSSCGHDDARKGNAAIEAVLAEMRRIDAAMSTYKPTASCRMVNARAAQEPIKISPRVVRSARHLAGIFRASPTARSTSPTPASATCTTSGSTCARTTKQIAAALPGINYRHVSSIAKTRTVHFARPGVRIDLGGIGKGHAVDRGIAVLQSARHQARAGHRRRRQPHHRRSLRQALGRRHPSSGPQGRSDRAHSAGRRGALDVGRLRTLLRRGRRALSPHHRSEAPAHSASKVRSATIIGPTATRTDGLSKTAFVLGPEKRDRDLQPPGRHRCGAGDARRKSALHARA